MDGQWRIQGGGGYGVVNPPPENYSMLYNTIIMLFNSMI